jgi:hypothetical protein
MANTNFKGRQAGTIKKKSIIEDPVLGNYKIIIDEGCYNVIQTDPLTQSEKPYGYFTKLSAALFSISKQQALDIPKYTIKEYAKQVETNFKNLTNTIKL